METTTKNQRNGILDFLIVIMALVLFLRTVDVLSYFSPPILSLIMGQDVSFFYGVLCASAIEGTMLFLHFDRRAHFHTPAIWVKWSLLAISGLAQIYDGYIITDTLSQQSDVLKLIFSIGVPILPLIVVTMIMSIGILPETVERTPFIGIKNIPSKFSWIWEGEKVYQPLANPIPTPTNIVQEPLANSEESVGKVNPTLGKAN